MTGKSSRFKEAGVSLPKQFLKVKNKMIIDYILELFPDEKDINLLVNKEQLGDAVLAPYFEKLDNYNIVPISYQDKGPGGALLSSNLLKTDKQVFINYCDFANIWDWKKVKQFIEDFEPDGLIPAYSGLHPHSIYGNDYAFLKIKNQKVLSIREKKAFTENKMQELASTGGYYFKTGVMAKKYIERVFEEKLFVNNEVYISTPYEFMIQDGLKVTPYKVSNFFQWGTPEDYFEFLYNLGEVENVVNKDKIDLREINLVIPAAGSGERFKNENYITPKILLPVNKKPLIVNIIKSFKNQLSTKILLKSNNDSVIEELNNNFNNLDIITIEEKTENQSESALKLINQIENNNPILVHSADSILDKDVNLDLKNFDVGILTKQNYRKAFHSYKNYGWVNAFDGVIDSFSIKKRPSNEKSTVMTGIFIFKDKEIFKYLYHETKKNIENKIEMHIDYLIETAFNKKMNVVEIKTDKTAMIGTPLEYELFNYMVKVNSYLSSKK